MDTSRGQSRAEFLPTAPQGRTSVPCDWNLDHEPDIPPYGELRTARRSGWMTGWVMNSLGRTRARLTTSRHTLTTTPANVSPVLLTCSATTFRPGRVFAM